MHYWALTDTGRVRAENQDSWLVRSTESPDGKEILTAVVCDGMGGAKAGNVASRMGVERFAEYLCPGLEEVAQVDLAAPLAVREANRAIYDLAFAIPEYEGMGTTLVAAVTDGREARIVNIGDSRCYLVRNRNFITRALGTDADVICDVFRETLEPGDVLLLCSDGLSGIVNPQELLFEIAYGGELESAADRMMEIALERGAPDNVTLILLSADGSATEG